MPSRILVTGGAKGIGAGIVRALSAVGHEVVFTYRSSGSQASALAADLSAAGGGRVEAIALDLSDKTAIAAFCQDSEALGDISGLVHNAGQSYDTLSMMMAQDKAEAAMQVNFWSFTRLIKALSRSKIGRAHV